MDIQNDTGFAAAPDIQVSILDGEAALLNIRTGAYFGLNAVGTLIWKAYTEEHRPFGEVVQAVCREFSVTPEVADRDARRFTEKILARGLLKPR